MPAAVLFAALPAFVPHALAQSDSYAATPAPSVPPPRQAVQEATRLLGQQPAAVATRPKTAAKPLASAPLSVAPATVSGLYSVTAAQIPPVVLAAYIQAAKMLDNRYPGCHLSWTILAGIGQVESNQAAAGGADAAHWNGIANPPIIGPALNGTGGFAAVPAGPDGARLDGDPVWAHAVGPMQFLPSSWVAYAVDADGDGVANPQDIRDAAATAANYLCAGGTDLSQPVQLAAAVYDYNHSDSYVGAVLTAAAGYGATTVDVPGFQSAVQIALNFVYSQLGMPYQWGGDGPYYDCSGLVQAAYRVAGIDLPRTSEEQWQAIPHVPVADVEPGDLLFFNPGEFVPGMPGHVGIYIGNGEMIDDPYTGAVVRVDPVDLSTVFGVARPVLVAPGSAATLAVQPLPAVHGPATGSPSKPGKSAAPATGDSAKGEGQDKPGPASQGLGATGVGNGAAGQGQGSGQGSGQGNGNGSGVSGQGLGNGLSGQGNGQGNGDANGNSGQGNGNSGQGNGNSGQGNGNSGQGNGNSSQGNGNSGQGQGQGRGQGSGSGVSGQGNGQGNGNSGQGQGQGSGQGSGSGVSGQGQGNGNSGQGNGNSGQGAQTNGSAGTGDPTCPPVGEGTPPLNTALTSTNGNSPPDGQASSSSQSAGVQNPGGCQDPTGQPSASGQGSQTQTQTQAQTQTQNGGSGGRYVGKHRL